MNDQSYGDLAHGRGCSGADVLNRSGPLSSLTKPDNFLTFQNGTCVRVPRCGMIWKRAGNGAVIFENPDY